DVCSVRSWTELRIAVREAAALPLVVVDPYAEGAGGDGPSPSLRAFLRDFNYVPVVAALETRGPRFRDLRVLGAWGISEIISLDQEAIAEALAQRLRAVTGRAMRTLLRDALPSFLSTRALTIALAAAESVSAGGHARSLARSMHVSRRTLSRWCVRSGLPAPRRLMAWMRILFAAQLLDDPRRKVGSIAYTCGYSSDNALRTAIHAFLGLTPRAMRKLGAFTTASRALVAELTAVREQKRKEAEAERVRRKEALAPL
ncbi:MAG TPA: helix-turn-helix domain-containing protein, partial [Longimicrobiaceae bacterium]|nr:helix-turn-helix domain-containing protein [Longimicrobiaceae bacterium]